MATLAWHSNFHSEGPKQEEDMVCEPVLAGVTDVAFTQLGEVTGHWGKGLIKRMCFSLSKTAEVRS